MSLGKKIFLSILSVMLVIVLAIVGYGAKVYFDIKGTATGIQEEVARPKSSLRDKKVELGKGDAFSVLLLGLDTGDLGRDEQGRSDTMLVATVNPKSNKTTLVSLSRDTYTEIVGQGTVDKLNHAYAFGGAEMAIASVENLLQIPIDHYVTINMKGLKELVDAVDGVSVENTLEFSQDGFDFPLGTLRLNGEAALAFSRMRDQDPKGDYGRQDRQRKIINSIVKKSISLSTLTGYTDILKAIENNMKTDLSWDNMLDLQKRYKASFDNMEMEALVGDGVMIDGVSYQQIPAEELNRVQQLLQGELAN
ncbi:LCP family glycopolymer transferase [Vagococcus salmoninarum]|uniref:Transcriptional regulator n=1 Tax=Vagococcus salmoninarum TaxID=2739 RepID=A0A429ZKL0_9ENTE|nr:LCP family protein [Vagococcus salmoninarum]RST94203.1 transcriptional regulator [Vagococcus salmoninarum]